MSPLFFTSSVLLFTLLFQIPSFLSQSNLFSDKCGNFTVPFPFHFNASSSSAATAFRLSCTNSSVLHLTLGRQNYRVIEFFSDGILVDFPVSFSSSSTCRQYNDLNSFGFSGDDYFGISAENVVGLYDCEDSSLCKAGCETSELPGCDSGGGALTCCYPLSDHSAWRFGNGFSVFSEYGCRGFSSWVVSRGTNRGKRGVKLEWAVPGNSSEALCDRNARIVNATAIEGGVRCLCQDGFVGDGFADGIGCLKSCYKDGKEAYGEDCFSKKHNGRKLAVIAGVLAPAFIIGSLLALFCLLKRPIKPGKFESAAEAGFNSTISYSKDSRIRLFAYQELAEAAKGFKDTQKLAEGKSGSTYSGTLNDGSRVTIHKVHCESQREFVEVSSHIDHLSGVLHRNLARIIGFCMDYGYTLLVVYEYPVNGTLEEHLHLNQSGNKRSDLDWYKRVNIVAETASLLAFLQYETSPPIFHHDLKPCYIFLDEDFSAKIAGFGNVQTKKNDVYDFGVLLLEMITGSKQQQGAVTSALQKIRNGKVEELVDPLLYYHEQPGFCREQIGRVADIATRCVLFGGDGKFGIIDVARELVQIIGGSGKKGSALEETFSNSSLLQMISMSPDSSIYLPKA